MKLLVIFITLLFILPQQTDKYYVVKVSGEILNTATGKYLNQVDEVLPDDWVDFANKGSY